MQAIKTCGLTKNYGKNRGICDVNLSVNEGDFFGFIGPNGAGKSTTIRILFNFIFPTGGSADIFGFDCVRESEKIKKLVGYVPSDVNYYKEMSVGGLLRYAASFHKNIDDSRTKKLIELFEVDLKKKVGELSLGNRKKAAIITALLGKPKLLVLDEPANGLDPLMQNRLFETLRQENEDGTTIFFSSHNLSEVQRYCSSIGIIKEGRLIEQKATSALSGLNHVKVSLSLKGGGDAFTKEISSLKVSGFAAKGRFINFNYSGGVDELTRVLSKYHLDTLRIEEPTLEEIFMQYYEKGDGR